MKPCCQINSCYYYTQTAAVIDDALCGFGLESQIFNPYCPSALVMSTLCITELYLNGTITDRRRTLIYIRACDDDDDDDYEMYRERYKLSNLMKQLKSLQCDLLEVKFDIYIGLVNS